MLAAGKWPTVSGSAQPERVPAADHLQAPLALVEVGHCKLQAPYKVAVVLGTVRCHCTGGWLWVEVCGRYL